MVDQINRVLVDLYGQKQSNFITQTPTTDGRLVKEINLSNSDCETKWYAFPLVSPGRGSRLVSAVSRGQREVIRETEKPNVFGWF